MFTPFEASKVASYRFLKIIGSYLSNLTALSAAAASTESSPSYDLSQSLLSLKTFLPVHPSAFPFAANAVEALVEMLSMQASAAAK